MPLVRPIKAATYKLDTAAAMRSQVNAQLQGIMPLSMEYEGLGKDIAGQYGFSSQADIGRFSSISASMQAYNDGDLSPMQYQMAASLTNQLQNYQTGAASGFLRNAGAAGCRSNASDGADLWLTFHNDVATTSQDPGKLQ